ncbi:polysaccharide deacetylase family protein [Thermodesulfatator indicus]
MFRFWYVLPPKIKKRFLLVLGAGLSSCPIFLKPAFRRTAPWFIGSSLLALDTFVPQVNILSKSFWRAKNVTQEIAITFDDGPDAEITPKLLDLLAQEKAKATFFVLAKRAKRLPELIQRIEKEGHELAFHGLDHQKIWKLSLKKFSRQIEQGLAILESISSKPIIWYRPPHGFIRFDQYLWLRKKGLRLAGWTIGVWDTDENVTAQEISERILASLRPGDILLLHDGVADRLRPQTAMLKAFKKTLPVIKKQGLKPLTLSSLWRISQGGISAF